MADFKDSVTSNPFRFTTGRPVNSSGTSMRTSTSPPVTVVGRVDTVEIENEAHHAADAQQARTTTAGFMRLDRWNTERAYRVRGAIADRDGVSRTPWLRCAPANTAT